MYTQACTHTQRKTSDQYRVLVVIITSTQQTGETPGPARGKRMMKYVDRKSRRRRRRGRRGRGTNDTVRGWMRGDDACVGGQRGNNSEYCLRSRETHDTADACQKFNDSPSISSGETTRKQQQQPIREPPAGGLSGGPRASCPSALL